MPATAPPRPVQMRFLQKLQKELDSTTDVLEYAVSKVWVAALQRYLEADEACECTVPPLAASDWDDHNVYVGEKSWTVLASWYGLDSQYPFRRRSSMAGYVCISLPGDGSQADRSGNTFVLADNKLDFLTVHCCMLKDLAADVKQPYINIYFWEALDYVEFQVRCMLKIHPETDVRMWLSFSVGGTDSLLENLNLYSRSSTSVGLIICQKHVEVLDILQKRQTAIAIRLPQKGSGGYPFKEDLSTLFVAHDWKLTLCLEVQTPAFTAKCPAGTATSSAVPHVFSSLPLNNIFQPQPQAQATPDWDAEVKGLLDDSVSQFYKLAVDQQETLEERAGQLVRAARESYQAKEQAVDTKMEEMELKETRLNDREKELNEREHELNSKLAKFKSMLTEFLMNKEKFEKEAAKQKEQNALTASRVDLNVGGTRYTTSLTTLQKEEGSTLKAMFSGQHPLTPDTDGSYFIDRDGTHFRHILNFLRDGPASLQHVASSDLRVLSELCIEAEHYQLTRMVETLHAKMAQGTHGAHFASLPS